MSSVTPSSTNISTALSELLSTGKHGFDPSKVRYVCHTSTIPLATTVNEQAVLKTVDDSVELSHSVKAIDPDWDFINPYRCCKKHCMYFNKKHDSEPELLRTNCPCNEIVFTNYHGDEEVDVYLQPLCFLQVLKELRYTFGYTDASVCDTDPECCHNDDEIPKSNRPRVRFEEIMFCQNSQSILDSVYSRPLRNLVGFSGWESANTPQRLAKVLDQLYWFKFVKDRTRRKLDEFAFQNFGFFKQCITQTLHTLNGQLCKKFLLFPCEMEGYRDLAVNTSSLFQDLIHDYLRQPSKIGEITPDHTTSVFLRMKYIMKRVKEQFCSTNKEIRFACLDLILDNGNRNAFAKFWARSVSRLKRRIQGIETDYTTSIAWINTMSGFSQTRNLGYLPRWVAEVKRAEFRATIGRDKVHVEKDHLRMIRRIVQKRQLDAGIEPKFLIMEGRETNADFKEVINSIKLPLKPTASVHSTVSQGGKVEDARQLLDDAIKNKWRVPVRDLETGSIDEWISLDESLRDKRPSHESYLFWISLQLVLNNLGSRFRKFASFVIPLPNSSEWVEELWKMTIVHISEPGKERNLTKTSSPISWVLTVCSKVSQMVLAYNQDHRAGLVLAAQDWMHSRRVASESYESFWMYDLRTRKRLPDVWNGFQDWTESTDYIPRAVGGTALQAWLEYIAFPRWYGDLVVVMTQMDYKVSEYLQTSFVEGIPERITYEGVVTEGFMMSMPLTKTILHLMHDVNIGFAHAILEQLGVRVSKPPNQSTFDPGYIYPGTLHVNPEDVA